MNKKWKIGLTVFVLLLTIVMYFFYKPVDIKPSILGKKIAKENYIEGKKLLKEMQLAYGSKKKWLAYETAQYVQEVDWYGDKLGISGWDELPQQFQMTSVLGTDNSELTLLTGKKKGQSWGIENWNYYKRNTSGEKKSIPDDVYKQKLLYKNYWFQFPFRIDEAPIIAYADEGEVDGETYDLLYITWESENANRQYDQYVAYIDKKTRLIEWLHFTIRDKFKFIHSTAHFTDFKTINGLIMPFTQYVTRGKPQGSRPKMHENKYHWIQFGKEKVKR